MESANISEETILNAAREVFLEKGMAGARMQEIADKAGINKAMLHYYFRSKDKLFDRVFIEAFKAFWPKVESAILSTSEPVKVFEAIVDSYLSLFIDKPYLPNFILNETQRHPDKIEQLMKEAGLQPLRMVTFINEHIKNGSIKQHDPREIMINVLSLCIYPFAGRPLIARLLFDGNLEAFDQFLMGRKASIMAILNQCYFNTNKTL